MKTIKQACTPRQTTFDAAKRDTVLSLTNLIRDEIKPEEFFAENYTTQGMRLLLENGFKRLEGKSDQGIFRLTQAMGGGKTHNLIAFGLLARYPAFRNQVMGDFYKPGPIDKVRIAAFSGRESDAPFGIWGAVAEQLGRREFFKENYTPLSAPGRTAWVNLLQGQPLIIMLDELPPYFENAQAKQIGNSDLSVVTGTALANLLIAVTEELPNVCVVITDLTAAYAGGSQQIGNALANLQSEAGRVAMDLEPVRMNTDEFYHILRKRLFAGLPNEETIGEVSQGYAKALRDAKQMDVVSASPEQFAGEILESYPFHPRLRDLYARFRENQGFQQTRGLIRLMRVVVSHLWQDKASDPYLIGPQTLDLNDRETLSEVRNINPTLENAISHDIASGGQAEAEKMDANLGGTDTQDAAKLLLISSLGSVPGALRGLSVAEVCNILCEPGRDISRVKTDVLPTFFAAAWYLHPAGDGRLFFKDVQNLVAKLNTTAISYLREQSIKELKGYLLRIFQPADKWCYQDVKALPAVDEIELQQERVLLVISQPHSEGLHPDLKAFYEQATYQNRVLFLTGQRNFDSMLEAAKRHKAIQAIIDEMVKDKTPANDPQMIQAGELHDKLQGQLLFAIKETFTSLQYPTKNGLQGAEFLMKYVGNEYKGEAQVVEALKTDQKYTEDIVSETFLKKVEQRLFTQKDMPWAEIKKRAATNTQWQWHRPDALDALKADCLRKDIWRENGSYVEKGPFPKASTSLKVQVLSRDDETGLVKLRLNPINADLVYAEVGGEATTASRKVNDQVYETDDLAVSFLPVDSAGRSPNGEPYVWRNTITLKSRAYRSAADMMAELKAAPKAAIRYTTDGSNPKTAGVPYDGPFVVPAGTQLVQAVAEAQGIQSDVHRLEIPWDRSKAFQVDPGKPATWSRAQQGRDTQSTYELLAKFKKYEAKLAGVSLTVSEDAGRWAEANFGNQVELTPVQVETIIEMFRPLLGEVVVTAQFQRVIFGKGQDLLDLAKDDKLELKPSEVSQ